MKEYAHRCPDCGEFTSTLSEATCPACKKPAKRIWLVNLGKGTHPTKGRD